MEKVRGMRLIRTSTHTYCRPFALILSVIIFIFSGHKFYFIINEVTRQLTFFFFFLQVSFEIPQSAM
jgi:hypothetical protein